MSCVVCLPGKCGGAANCPFVDVFPDDPSVKEENIFRVIKIFDAFDKGFIKESLISAKGVDAKKALVEDWLLQYEANEKNYQIDNELQEYYHPIEDDDDSDHDMLDRCSKRTDAMDMDVVPTKAVGQKPKEKEKQSDAEVVCGSVKADTEEECKKFKGRKHNDEPDKHVMDMDVVPTKAVGQKRKEKEKKSDAEVVCGSVKADTEEECKKFKGRKHNDEPDKDGAGAAAGP